MHAYHIHVCTAECPRGDGGPGALGAELLVRYRGKAGTVLSEAIDLDTDNLTRSLRNEVELLDSGFFGIRFEEIDEDKDRERSQRRIHGKGLRTRDVASGT